MTSEPPSSAPSPEDILRAASEVALTQDGGALATMHAEDGTPYVTYVLFHLRPNGELIFPAMARAQHVRNLDATPECSMLIDNRAIVQEDTTQFTRIVVEGRGERVHHEDPIYATLLAELRDKVELAARIADNGCIYRIRPRRLISMTGYAAARLVVDFDGD